MNVNGANFGGEMRVALWVILAFAAAGCTDFASLRPQPALSAPGPCGQLARERLNDAVMAGEADGIEGAVFNKTYQDCLAAVKRFGQP